MTKEEKLEILQAAEVRAYGAVASTEGPDMGAEGFLTLLHAIEQLAWNQERLKDPGRSLYFEGNGDCGVETESGSELGEETQGPEAVQEVSPSSASAAQTPNEPTEPEPEPPTKDQVRAQLARYQANANLDVPALMKSMGYSKLSEIPANRYWELLELAQKTVDGEG